MKEGKLKKIIKIDWTIFYSKPRIQILGILIFLDIMLLFSVTKEMEKEIGMTQYSMLAYELEKAGKAKFEEIPITKETTVELLKK